MNNTVLKLLCFLVTSVCVCGATTVTVEWDPALTALNGESLDNVTYKVYYGDAPDAYTSVVETADTSVELDVEYNKTYYFSVKSCVDNVESDYSEALSWTTRVMKDEDEDGISDDWEMTYFENLTSADSLSDYDKNGVSDLAEFMSGTNPTDPQDCLMLDFDENGMVSFEARTAAGYGYENRERIYSLQYREDLASGEWVDVSGMDQIVAEGQPVQFETASSERRGFYRTRISLN